MTKKDFELIAATIQKVRAPEEPEHFVNAEAFDKMTREIIAGCFADALASQNPRFDRERFLRACVPGANVRARGSK